jgi:hypothetical protein
MLKNEKSVSKKKEKKKKKAKVKKEKEDICGIVKILKNKGKSGGSLHSK